MIEPGKMLAAVAALGLILLLVTRWRVHPFLALSAVAIGLGVVCGLSPVKAIASFESGFGDVAGHIGIIVALGVILGGILAASGGVEQIAEGILASRLTRWLPWLVCAAALLVGLPLFFEVGLVLLAPIALAVARRARLSPMQLGLPLLAGLIGAHGLLPPHPAPTLAVIAFQADAGKTLLYGLLVAVPTLAVAGPGLTRILFRHGAPTAAITSAEVTAPRSLPAPPPWKIYTALLIPPVLMLLRTAATMMGLTHGVAAAIQFAGDPVIALFAAVLFAWSRLGVGLGLSPQQLHDGAVASLAGAAGIILITGAGGGLKQVLIDTGFGNQVAAWAMTTSMRPLVLAWLLAAALRVAIGTSTVATIMASGLLAPIAARDPSINRELLVLATGCGSIFGSHVNDPGFWFIKQYFGLSLLTTFATWTVLTVVLSLTGLGCVLLLSLCL